MIDEDLALHPHSPYSFGTISGSCFLISTPGESDAMGVPVTTKGLAKEDFF